MAPKASTKITPAVLSAEAAAMEKKLEELRKAMEKERAKREALMANNGGSIWRSAAASGRPNVKGRGPEPGSTGSPASARQRPGSVDSPGQGSPVPSSGGSTARATPEPAAMPTVAGSRLTAARPAGSASGGNSRVNILDLRGSSGGGVEVGGMCCGPDDDKSLASGAFNEADSHRSFLDALNEWRRGNKGDAGDATGDENSGGAAAGTSSSAAAAAGPPSTSEVQTDVRPVARPQSAKPLSYFDKLVINTHSRQAGQMATGGPAEPVRSSLSGLDWRAALAASRPGSAPLSGGAGPAAPAGSTTSPSSPGPATASASASTAAASGVRSSMSRDKASGLRSSVSAGGDKAGSAGTQGPDADAAAAAAGAASSDPLSILDKLEALERQRQAALEQEEEEEEGDGAGRIQVTTATKALTKGVRLPDDVILPAEED